MNANLRARLVAEFLGTAFLLAAVIGSGVMGERLAGGNVAIALLANTISTGTILVVLILALGPISGAHFNPAVTLAMAIEKRTPWREFRIRRRPTQWFVCRSRTSVDSIAPK
jgi:glycerol uptake facilitator-like aquaporin